MVRIITPPLALSSGRFGSIINPVAPKSVTTTSSQKVEHIGQPGTLVPSKVASTLYKYNLILTRSLFLGSFGRKLLRPKNSNILNNEAASPVLLGSHDEPLLRNQIINKKIWDNDFIEYQNSLQVDVLKELFGISNLRAESIVQRHPIFNFTDSELIRDNFSYLQNQGLGKERIFKLPSLLALKTSVIEVQAEKVMSLLNISTFSTAASFLELPVQRLLHLSKLWKSELRSNQNHVKIYANRLYLMASDLNCEPYKVSEMMTKVPYLMSGTFYSSIYPKLQFLLSAGMSSSDIIKDPWVFTQNVKVLEERYELCKQNSLTTIKPWMFRATMKSFNDYVKRINQEDELLAPHGDITGFLKDSLECDSSTVYRMLQRVPSLRSASASKLNEMIQFLYSCGYTSKDIVNAPSVLAHSQATIEGRLSELDEFGYRTEVFLNALCQSSKRYKTFRQKLNFTNNESNGGEK